MAPRYTFASMRDLPSPKRGGALICHIRPRSPDALTGPKPGSNNARMKAARGPPNPPISAAGRQARGAWRLQYRDSRQSLVLAEQACARALATADAAAEGWARLTRGVHLLRYGPRTDARTDLARAQECFDALD